MMAVYKIILFIMFLPLALIYHPSKLIFGKEKARNFFYEKIVQVSAKVLSWSIPELKEGEPFTKFNRDFKKGLSFMVFEIINLDIETDVMFRLKITRCQFVEVFKLLGISELTRALCEGDQRFCFKYQPRIDFRRENTIEKGDGFCDHTFILKE